MKTRNISQIPPEKKGHGGFGGREGGEAMDWFFFRFGGEGEGGKEVCVDVCEREGSGEGRES